MLTGIVPVYVPVPVVVLVNAILSGTVTVYPDPTSAVIAVDADLLVAANAGAVLMPSIITKLNAAAISFFIFMIMEQDTPSIAVRLRWGGMRFLEKTKIQHFLLTSFQHLDDLYPCSRMANNLNFGNCYGLLLFRLSRVGVPCQDGR